MNPQDNNTKMVAPQPDNKTKMVKIRALRPINTSIGPLAPGQEKEVPEEDAREFCDRVFQGPYDFAGEVPEKHATRHLVRRAERL